MRINKFQVCSVEYKWIQIKKIGKVNGIEKNQKVGTENWDFFLNKKEHYCLPKKKKSN